MRCFPERPCSPGWLAASALLVGVLLPSSGLAGPILGQVDTFQDGTLQNWATGNRGPGQPINISNGGPAGSGDHYLLLTANGGRADGRLTVFNRSQWAGNFLAAGVNAVEMDLKNFGTTPLFIRVAVKSNTGATSPGFVSTVPFVLPADGEWHHAFFPLGEASLTEVNSTILSLAALLSNVGEFRILNGQNPELNGDPITSQLGVDNIQATVIPEPGTLALLGLGCGLLALASRLRRRRGSLPLGGGPQGAGGPVP
jgi:hypothetical protein